MRISLAALLLLLAAVGCGRKEPEKQAPAAARPADAAPPGAPHAVPADAAPPPAGAQETERAGDAAYRSGDHGRAARLFDVACQRRHPRACESRAALHEKGEGGPVDMARARELRVTALRLYQEQCDAGAPASCKELSWWLGTGGYSWDTALLPADPARAAELYTRAAELYLVLCEKGDGDMCSDLDSWLEDGSDLAKYAQEAAAGFRRKHPRKTIFTHACDAGHGYGCYQLGEMAGPGRAQAALFEKGCSAGFKGGCQALGSVLEDGRGVPRDQPAALAAYLRGCAIDVDVCFEACQLGDQLATAQPAACDKACAAGYWPSACVMGR